MIKNHPSDCRGKIIFVRNDKNGLQYGFISREPTDIFFHSQDQLNPGRNFFDYKNREVIYEIIDNDGKYDDREKAHILKIIDNRD